MMSSKRLATPAILVFGLIMIVTAPVSAWAASITLSWTAPGDDGSVGTASQYDIRYSTSTITDANWAAATQVSGEPAPKASGLAETYTVTGLASSTKYYFAIKTADDASNWSALSNIASATTSDSVAPAAIANLTAGP